MNTAAALLAELDGLGISARVKNGNLRLRPKGKVTPETLARLQPHKAEIVQALRSKRLAALNADQLDAWQERVAICTIDGGLSEEEAESIAWAEIDGQPVSENRKRQLEPGGRQR